jgi:hypothetical protein
MNPIAHWHFVQIKATASGLNFQKYFQNNMYIIFTISFYIILKLCLLESFMETLSRACYNDM